MAKQSNDDDVPKLPRGRGLSFSFAEILRILVVATALLALLVLQKPCAKSVSQFVTGFGPKDAGVSPPPAVDAAVMPSGVILRADMTPEQQAAAIAAARGQGLDAGVATDAGGGGDGDAR
ncbi:MAG: hypothetical protein JNK64_11875 [Myxococcales bacterium]|nr:hypothetical protein [Myxococcales bacterium]